MTRRTDDVVKGPSAGTEWHPLISKDRLDEAASLIEQHLESSPRDAAALHDLGVVLGRKKRFEEAAEQFRAAATIDPSRHGTWRNLARACEDGGRLDDAEPCLARVAQLLPDDAVAHFELGRLRARLGRNDAAAAALGRAVELDPGSAEGYFDLGKVLSEANRPGEAKAAYLRAVELDPASSDAFNSLGVACQHLGLLDDAVGYLSEAVRLRPGTAPAYNNLGRCV